MPTWLEVVLSIAMPWAAVEFVAWCIRDCLADVAWWKEQDSDSQ